MIRYVQINDVNETPPGRFYNDYVSYVTMELPFRKFAKMINLKKVALGLVLLLPIQKNWQFRDH